MATGDIAPAAGIDLGSLINTFTGKNSTTNSSDNKTQTTSQNISDAGVKELINQILSGNKGIASIANAEHSAGLYGGSTSTLLTNDLLTQTAAKIEAARTGTTTTQTGGTSTTTNQKAPLNPLTTGAALAGYSLVSQILKGATGGGITDLVKQGASGLTSLVKGATGNFGTPTENSADHLTPQQIEAGVTSSDGSDPNTGNAGNYFDYGPGPIDPTDLSGTSSIPIASLFPESGGTAWSDWGSWATDDSSGNSDNEDDSSNGPGD